MNILDVCIVDIVSEEHLNRTVKVTMDVDCWGDESRVTGGFLKADWEKYKKTTPTEWYNSGTAC